MLEAIFILDYHLGFKQSTTIMNKQQS